jgi:hypothetical protein
MFSRTRTHCEVVFWFEGADFYGGRAGEVEVWEWVDLVVEGF